MDIPRNATPISIRLEHTHKKRYYLIYLSQDLFGDWVMTRAWGGINQATGRVTHLSCSSFEHGTNLVEKLLRLRISRGYEINGVKSPHYPSGYKIK